MSTSRNRRPRRAAHRPLGFAKQPLCERLEARVLLAAGPYLHVHNVDTLAVVDASNGDLDTFKRMTGFQGESCG